MIILSKQELSDIVGNSFEEMSIQQMTDIQGMGVTQIQSTPTIAISRAGIAASRASSARCARWVSAAAGGIYTWRKHH